MKIVNRWELMYLESPISFMNIFISDAFHFPSVPFPIVNSVAPNTWRVAKDTRSFKESETFPAAFNIVLSKSSALAFAAG